ncbi:MAG: GNAT family N-acetyltransferase [Ruegeria sp.]
MSEYQIRPLSADELRHAVDWAGREGWNPGLRDAACFRSTDPDGFLGGFLEGEMIASVSAVNYDDAFSFLGFYIVRPEFRGSGHGLEIAQHAMAHCTGRNMGLDGVVEQQDNYRKSGFVFAYNNYRFSGTVSGILSRLPDIEIATVSVTGCTAELRDYDRDLFPARRDAFLDGWLSAQGHVSRTCFQEGRITGYATLRPCLTGYKVGPLFADDTAVAQALLSGLLADIPAKDATAEVYIDMPQPNATAFELANALGLEKVFETARMYSDHEPQIDLDRVFGITTFELG